MRYGHDPEDVHENMHLNRRARKYNGHKLARAIGRHPHKHRVPNSVAGPLSGYNAQLRKIKG